MVGLFDDLVDPPFVFLFVICSSLGALFTLTLKLQERLF